MLKEQQRGRCGWSRAGWEMKYEESAGEKSFRATGDFGSYFLFYFLFLSLPCSMWDLNSLPRD